MIFKQVQRLIAESPNICLEDGAYLGKPLKGSSAKKRPLEYPVKPYPHIVKHKDDSENPSHKMECSAENAVGKTSLSSVQNVSQPSSYGPCTGNPLPPPVVADPKSSPCFNQPTGHQWLIPVMSPSEGLIYKPYPGHGFTGLVCGGFGPPGSNPLMGNFMNLAYGVPASHHHYQGIGVSPPPPFGHGCFPPYGMPVISPAVSGSAVEHGNNFTCGQTGQLVGGEANFNVQHQSSCNMLTQKNGAIPNVVKPHVSKESELQGSTASSPGKRAPETVVGQTTVGGNALPLFPTCPAVHAPQGAYELHDNTDQPTRVIRVVPHNARSATESVARIFQSIQEERKQHDSV